MRIAIISDTHDRVPRTLPGRLQGADEIWHLGDVCAPSILSSFTALGVPLQVVRGNCDSFEWPMGLDLIREGRKISLVHIPPAHASPGVSAVLHGHTHVPRNEIIDGVRWLNPGCITRPNRGAPASFAWLRVVQGEALHWETVRL